MPVAPSDPAAGCRETHGVELSTSPAAPHSFPKPRCAGLGNTRQRDPRPAPARWGRRRLRAGARRGLALALKTVLWGAQARVHVVKGHVARTAPGHLAIIEAPGTVAGPGRRRPVTAAMPPASDRHCFALCRAFWRSPRAQLGLQLPDLRRRVDADRAPFVLPYGLRLGEAPIGCRYGNLTH